MLVYDESRAYPIAILVTMRLEGLDTNTFEGSSGQKIDLLRLTKEELTQMAEIFLKNRVSPGFSELLQERSAGNPFFAEQILRYIQEEHLLEAGPEGLRLSNMKDSFLLPISVRSVLVARLDRLTQEVKALVQTASVIGMEFDLPLLFSMVPDAGQAQDQVRVAEGAWIWSPAGDKRYLFRHTLVQEAAYSMQLRARRLGLHAQVALAMELLYAENLNLYYGELAYHYEMAGMTDRARVFYNRAGDAARETYQNSRAIAAYSKALDLTPSGEYETCFMLLMSREALADLIGAREAQRADLEALDQLLESVGERILAGQRAVVAGRWANFRNLTGDYPGAVAAAEQAVALADLQVAPTAAVQAYSIWSDGLYRQGRHAEAMERGHAGLELARQVGDLKGQSSLLNLLGWIAFEYKGSVEAKDYFQRSLEIARAIGDRRTEARPLNNLGILAGSEGDYAAAQGYYEQALQISREIGSRNGEGLVLANLGWIARFQGDYPQALVYLEQSLRLAREVEDLFQEVYVLANLSAISFNLGDFAGAMAYAGNGLVLSRETGDRSAEAWCLMAQGNVYRKIGTLQRAQEAYQEALQIRRSLGQSNLACEPMAGMARVALDQKDYSSALEQVDAILTYLEGGGTLEGLDEPLWVYWTCYQTLKETGDPRASAVLQSGTTYLKYLADRITDEALRNSFLENVESNRSLLTAWAEQVAGGAV
jgi:predicted ATPase